MATSAKIIRYQLGSIVVSAPIGSLAMASESFLLLPERAAP